MLFVDSLNKGNKCFLEFSQSIRYCNHASPLNVLEIYQERSNVLNVFSTYLQDKSQIMEIGKPFIDPLKMKICWWILS